MKINKAIETRKNTTHTTCRYSPSNSSQESTFMYFIVRKVSVFDYFHCNSNFFPKETKEYIFEKGFFIHFSFIFNIEHWTNSKAKYGGMVNWQIVTEHFQN